jgi:sulfide:quinone oxidoreductase
MAKVVVIGAGFAGHTAALYLGKHLGRDHDITVINRFENFYYIPSWIWVAVGHMKPEKTYFALEPVYKKMNVNFLQGTVTTIHPDENFVDVDPAGGGQSMTVDYDYLIVATGPKLNYEGTEGLSQFSESVCTLPHAEEARDSYLKMVERMKAGENIKFVIGTGHPGATCQGAAFEYITNIHKDLVKQGIRDKAELVWLSNEKEIGDFGVRGVQMVHRNGEMLNSDEFMEAVFKDSQITWEVQKGVTKVEEGVIHWEDYDGNVGQTTFDFSMLIPQFIGPRLKYVGKDGEDVAHKVTNKSGFILVDAEYGLSHDELIKKPEAWPEYYQNPNYPNIFAAGIAFAPPGSISEPHVNPNGMNITAAPPRTGMVSAIIGRVVALNIVDLVNGRPDVAQ